MIKKINKPCQYFPNCKKGDQCQFIHDNSGGGNFNQGNGGPMGGEGGQGGIIGPGGGGGRLCKYGNNCNNFKMGKCTFLHSNDGMMGGGDFNQGDVGSMGGEGGQGGIIGPGGGGGRLCKYGNNCNNYKMGKCTFLHSNDGMMGGGGGGGMGMGNQGGGCFICGQPGHQKRDCPQNMNQNQPIQQQQQQQQQGGNFQNQPQNIQSFLQGGKYILSAPQLCRNFQKNTCQFGNTCRNRHEYTLKGDCFIKGFFNGQYGSVIQIQKLPEQINNKNLILVLSQKAAQIYQESDTDQSGLTEMYKKDILDQDLIATTSFYLNKYLFLGLYNTSTLNNPSMQKSTLLMINLNDNNEFTQTEMHNEQIISILFINSILVTTSSDSKIKFWVWSDAINKFDFKSYHQHPNAEITTIIDKTIMNKTCLLVGDSNGILTVYEVNIAQDSKVNLISQYNVQVHQGPIKSILVTEQNQNLRFISCGLEGSVSVTDPQNNQNNSNFLVDTEGITQMITATDFSKMPIFLTGLNNGSVSLFEIQAQNIIDNFQQYQYGNLTLHVAQQQGGYKKGGKYGQQNQSNAVTALHAYNYELQGENYSYFLIGTSNGTWSYWGFKKPITQ